MLSCLRDSYFPKLDYAEKRDLVLREIETMVECELTLNDIKLYVPTTLVEKIRLLYKETKNDSFVDSLIKELFVALELIQGKEITVERLAEIFLELQEKGEPADLAKIAADIEDRDYRDMHRDISPLRQAEDATLVDSSDMTIDQVVERILELCR